jgi:DNA-binding NarL/FixJ family response regulator
LPQGLARQAPETLPLQTAVTAREASLSWRELKVLDHFRKGWTNRQMGKALVITPHTVKVHVEHILLEAGR